MIGHQQEMRGAEKAAIVMLAAGETHSVNLFTRLAEGEIKEISEAMERFEHVDAKVVEGVLDEFANKAPVEEVPSSPAVLANAGERGATHNYAGQYETGPTLPAISVWKELVGIDPNRLALYLANEHPQTAAVVLARLDGEQAASVLTRLPEDFTADVVDRMLSTDSVKDEILTSVEATLRAEFIDGQGRNGDNSLNTVVELLNRLDPATEQRFLKSLSHRNRDAAKLIRKRCFAFEDLESLDTDDLARIAPLLKPSVLALALRGASDDLSDRLLKSFPTRVAQSIKAEMAVGGPVRLRDVDAAQSEIAGIVHASLGKRDISVGIGG